MYARDDTPLPPILTDGSWTVPFEFFGADTSHPLDQTGNTFDLTFAPKGRSQPAASDVHVLSTPDGITIVSNVVTVTNAVWTGWNPGVYQVELRQTNLANPDPIYVGTVTVAQGLSEVASLGGGSVIPAPPGAAVQLIYGASSVQIVRGEASESALQAQASAAAALASQNAAATSETNAASDASAAHADRLAADADAAATASDRTAVEAAQADVQTRQADVDAKAAQVASDATQTAADRVQTGQDRAATDADATATAADRVQTDADAASAAASASTATTQAGIATTQATNAAASATAAAQSAAGAAVNDTAGAAAIAEEVATNDPNATLAQVMATVNRGVENRPAASVGSSYFRIALKTSTALTGVASFTRATGATGTDQSGNVATYASGAPVVNTAGFASWVGTTNLTIQSQTLDNAAWTNNGLASISANVAVAPDGTTTAEKLIEAATTANHSLQCPSTTTTVQTYTLSCYFKAAERTKVMLYSLNGDGKGIGFDLSAGTTFAVSGIGAPASSSITALVNGWYRCSITFTGTALTNAVGAIYLLLDGTGTAYTGNGTSGLYAWGMQLEAGSLATPYIPTTTATASRNPDVASETVNVPKGQAFTVTGKFIGSPNGGGYVFSLADAASPTNALILFSNSFLRATANGIAGASHSAPGGGSTTPGNSVPCGFAISVSGSTITWSMNGAPPQTFTSEGGAFSAALTRLFVGCDNTGNQQLNSTIRELNIYMRAFSAAECQTASDVSLERNYDFTTQTYQYVGDSYGSIAELPGTTFTRASPATHLTLAGYLLNISSGALRVSDAGLTIETLATNVVLWNRDLTNAVWTPTNMTAAKDQVGIDGASNAASSLTAMAANATILQAITLASGARFQSAYVKRLTGSGVVNMTMDGGVTWTPITLTTSWARVSIPSQTLANPQVGFQIVTSGDKIAVDYVQNEAGAFWTGAIATTSAAVTRSNDDLHTNEANPASFSIFSKFTIPQMGQLSAYVWQWDDGQPSSQNKVSLALDRNNSRLTFQILNGGVSQCFIIFATGVTAGQTYKVAVAVAANDVAVVVNSGSGPGAPLTASAVTLPAMTRFTFNPSSAGCWGPGILQVKRWRGRRTNAQLQADAA